MAMRVERIKESEWVNNDRVFGFVNAAFGELMHLKRVKSLANAALGLLHSGELILHKIGEGLAFANKLNKKHATKQVDRLLSNKKLDIWYESEAWVPYIVGKRNEIMVSMDWTDFDTDGQSTIAVAILTLLGAAGESIGFDRKLKVNTVKTRTHSLLRQGMFYYKFLQKFTEDERTKLLDAFNTLLEGQSYWKSIFLCF